MSFTVKPNVSAAVIAILGMGVAVGCNVSLKGLGGQTDNNNTGYFYAFHSVDPLTGKDCWTDPHPYTAAQKDQYCKDLKDTTTNNNCAASSRRQRYLSDCGPDFPQVDPTPTPTPIPTPTPNPTPSVPPITDRPAVALELIAAGIDVRADDIGGAPTTGDSSFAVRLSRFWSVVEAKKQEILSRKDKIDVLSLTDRAQYNATDKKRKTLELAVNFDGNDLVHYLQLVDRRVALLSKAGMPIQFGVDVERYAKPDFARADATTAFFEGQAATLKESLSGLVKSVSLEYTTPYLYLEDGKLVLSPVSYENDFKSASARLAPLASFARYAAGKSLGIETSKYSGSRYHLELLSDEIGHLTSAFAALDREHAALEDLITRGVLSRLVILPADNFDIADGEMTISMTDDGIAQIGPVLKADSNFESIAATFSGVTVERKQTHLDASFILCVKRLENFKDAIKAKLSKINKIVLANAASGFADGILTIGSDASSGDLEKVIKNIKN